MRRGGGRPTVEEFLQLRVTDLTRAGVFRAPLGALCTVQWTDSEGKTMLFARFWLHRAPGASYLKLAFNDPVLLHEAQCTWTAIIVLTKTKCHFGGFRHWFRCKCESGGVRCNRRVGVLYLHRETNIWGCRNCFDLTYGSCQTHDNRVDRLVNADHAILKVMFWQGSFKQQLLAMKAITAITRKLAQKGRSWPR